MKERILQVLSSSKKPLSLESLCEKLQVDNNSLELINAMQELEKDFSVLKTKKEKYVSLEKTSFRKGRYIYLNNGNGKVAVKTSYFDSNNELVTKNIYYDVYSDDCNGAIDGDYVLINLYSKTRHSFPVAQVKMILDRKLDSLVGEVYKIGNDYYVKSLDKKKKSIVVKLDKYEVVGSKVLVDIKNDFGNNQYLGQVTRVFNHVFDSTEDVLLEALKCGIDYEFSKETLEEVKKIPNKVLDIDRIGRVDLTNEDIFTIDCVDTKDIDDALSCKKLSNGNYLVGVHIADVSNYVDINSAIEKDAYKRGTSTYLLGTVIPMLPPELSNGICSLNPMEERLAVSCLMEVDPHGNVVNHNIRKSIIKSKIKMNYDEVNKILYNQNYDSNYDKYVDTLKMLNELALILKQNRIKDGALNFKKSELEIEYDKDNKVSDIKIRNNDLGENLIEEFMLLANETVDKHLVSRGYKILHRIHDVPVVDRLEKFFRLLQVVGCEYTACSYNECAIYPKYMQDVEKHIRDTGRLSNALSTNLIRCMSKAKYSALNIGHYGLAKNYYCHFTSPIRRYPDLVIHRLLKLDMENKEDTVIEPNIDEIAYHSSKMEKISQGAEYEALKLRLAQYMENHIGEIYNGIVIDVDPSGLSVQLDNLIEGRVRVNDLKGRYVCKEDLFSLESLDNHDNYTVGDYLKLKVLSSSKEKKSIYFSVEGKIEDLSNAKKYIKNKTS